MSKFTSVSKVPKVLLQAKKEAGMKASNKGGGPWDKGHWANRK